MRTHAPWAALLLVAIVAVYGQVRSHEFLDYDDPRYVVENPNLREGLGLAAIARDFTEPYFGNWIPLTHLSLRVDYALYGLEPAGYLLTNVALHALASLLLFAALSHMTGAPGRSAFVAGVFALHPLHVESVAWVSERKDVLSGVFWMATLLAYAFYAERPGSKRRYAGVLLAFTLGLLAKPMLVTLPVVLLLLDYWPLGRLGRAGGRARALARLVLEKLPLLLLSLACAAVTLAVQRRAGALYPVEHLPPLARLGHAAESYWIYLAQSVWPSGLAAFYPHAFEAPPAWRAGAAALGLVAATVTALRLRRAHPYLPVGWLWFLVTLLPVIGVVQVGMQAHADRYTYLTQTGLALALAWTAVDRLGAARHRRRALGGAALLTLALLAGLSYAQLRHWRSSLALHERVVAVSPHSHRSQAHLAAAYLGLGRVDDAERHYRQAAALAPDAHAAILGLADVAMHRGDVAAALALYAKAAARDPEHSQGHASLGTALFRAGRFEEAGRAFERALALQDEVDRAAPRGAQPHFGMGDVAWVRGEREAALAHFERGLRIDPDFAEAHTSVGLLRLELGQPAGAAEALARARALGSDTARLALALGLLAQAEGRPGDAVAAYRRALDREPGLLPAANNLAWLLATSPDPALRDAEEALRLAEAAVRGTARREPAFLDTLAASQAAAGRFDAAAAVAEEAAARAEARGDAALAARARRHAALFTRGQALREEPGATGG